MAEDGGAAYAPDRLSLARRRSASADRAPMEILLFRSKNERRRMAVRAEATSGRQLGDSRLSIDILPPTCVLATRQIWPVVKASLKNFIFQMAAILASFLPRERPGDGEFRRSDDVFS